MQQHRKGLPTLVPAEATATQCALEHLVLLCRICGVKGTEVKVDRISDILLIRILLGVCIILDIISIWRELLTSFSLTELASPYTAARHVRRHQVREVYQTIQHADHIHVLQS